MKSHNKLNYSSKRSLKNKCKIIEVEMCFIIILVLLLSTSDGKKFKIQSQKEMESS